jgi:uracil DNA glycosylase
MEYALGLNPNTPAPLSQRITNDLDSNQYLRLTITKNPNATDVTYSVEASSDLTTWNTTEVLILQNTATVLQVRDTQAMSAANRRFMRLRVTQP